MKKVVLWAIIALFLISVLDMAFNIQSAKAWWIGTVYIRADGSVDPPTAPILRDGNIYTLTDVIYGSIIVEKDDIVIDGSGHILQGAGNGTGISLSGRTNVTVKNMQIKNFEHGIKLDRSSSNNISGNNITNNSYGIGAYSSSRNTISCNNITNNSYSGIYLWYSSSNNISGNNIANNLHSVILERSSGNIIGKNGITNNRDGVQFIDSSYNIISGNNLVKNRYYYYSGFGICFYEPSNYNIISENNIVDDFYGVMFYGSSGNRFYHNNFIDNRLQVCIQLYKTTNVWDDGYPSGGNYWSDYKGADSYSGPYQNEAGSDGIGDTPYIIDKDNIDRYPLMNPWMPIQFKFKVGDLVWATSDLHVRAGPGLSYSVIDTMIKGNKGTVLSGPVEDEGDGYKWWCINYSVGVVGWSAENWLELAPAPPTPTRNFAYWAEAAIKWAEQHLGSGKWSGYCLRFVANAFMQEEDKPAGWPSALDAARELYRFNQEPGGWQHAPRGALIFFDKEGSNEDGHVGIYLGNGSIIHAHGTVRVETVEEAIAKPDVGRYLGWAYPPESWRPTELIFNVEWEGVNYPLAIQTNSTVLGFNFDQPSAALGFIIGGETGTKGYCNITIPKSLIKGEPWTVKINGTTINFQSTSNQTHSFIYFTYTFASTLEVTIKGTWVVPEFPQALIPSLFMTLSMLLTAISKRRFQVKPKHNSLKTYSYAHKPS